jgi:hypothetical protein
MEHREHEAIIETFHASRNLFRIMLEFSWGEIHRIAFYYTLSEVSSEEGRW